MRHSILIIVLLGFGHSLFAQTERVNIPDVRVKETRIENNLTKEPSITLHDVYLSETRPLQQFAMPEVTLGNVQTKVISSSRLAFQDKLPTSFTPSVQIGLERKLPYAIVTIPQYIINSSGQLEKLLSYQLNVVEAQGTSRKTSGSRVYANHSVLANGNWYKIAVEKRGVYKVDYAFLKSTLGLDMSSINTANIRVYGNGGEELAESNAVPRYDDLTENAIWVEDGGDGKFDAGDYFLFYANGPHSYIKDSVQKRFTHHFNIYTESSNYFLNFELGPGKRIQNGASVGNPTLTVTSFNEFQFYEKDSVNLGKFGKRWWGDEFNDVPGRYLNRSFSFTIPDLVPNEPVYIRTVTGAVSNSGYSGMAVKANGQLIQSLQFEPFANVEDYAKPTAVVKDVTTLVSSLTSPITLNFNFTKGSSPAYGNLDFIEINARRNLILNGNLNFADWNSVGNGNIASYQIQNATAQTQVWDITDALQPIRMPSTLSGSVLSFAQSADYLHRFLALDGTSFESPRFVKKIDNQDLHGMSTVDYIVIADPSLLGEATRLANYHKTKRNYRIKVLTPEEIYNEFSSGTQDVAAIRDFLKMLYDRAAVNDIPRYVLLFGDASYDYKNRITGNTNLVPVSETNESLIKTEGYCSDDFFGFLDDHEDQNIFGGTQINMLDIGIGRIPVTTIKQASDVINKILRYDSPTSFGPWKNNMTFNADDEDSNTHLLDAEDMSKAVSDSLPVFNNYKIYVDGFVQQSTPAGPRTPDANKAVNEQMFNGTFLMNYNGHGGPTSWCEERILTMDDINAYSNANKLPLFITATCDFAPFDNPLKISAGETLLIKPDGGAIALMTTTQLVYADQNWIMNMNYMRSGFQRMDNGNYPTLGDAFRISKNRRYNTKLEKGEAANLRKFALLGDPGLPLAFPEYQLATDSVNGISITQYSDTLKALKKYTISGHVSDKNGQTLNDFNGIVYPTIFDKPKKLSTLRNDPKSIKTDYLVQNSILYKGKASVKNGKFSFTFVVPKDINYEVDYGKISYYAENGVKDGNGYDNKILIGGSAGLAGSDNLGPVIKGFMNDEKFVNGGIVNKNSILLLKLSDDNGINYTGNSVGHDITAILDGNTQDTYVLNNFFEADLDDYRSGVVKFPVTNLSEGTHSFTVKVWDIFNNSADAKIDFEVVGSDKGKLAHVYNYPNPFTTKTRFMFEHNMPNQNLYVGINIYTVTGKQVKAIRSIVNTEGTRSDTIEWDGRDELGDKLGKGVYIYKLFVKSQNGFSDSQLQKLILLQ